MLFNDDGTYAKQFFVYAVCCYVILRVACEFLFPGKMRGYTHQQFIISVFHQGVILPVVTLAWVLGLPDGPELTALSRKFNEGLEAARHRGTKYANSSASWCVSNFWRTI